MHLNKDLPEGIAVFERGWLSSNNIVLTGPAGTAVVDTGYVTHSGQTVDLVRRALDGQSLDAIFNTHLHSDHCGGNAALKLAFPSASISIPPGLADAVARWDRVALTYEPTGQSCDRFSFDSLLRPDTTIDMGNGRWEVHGAPGHDPHSVILFDPTSEVLISADALWESGFGVVFPELEGVSAFGEVADTLDLIESLAPRWVIPGHGRVFSADQLTAALTTARSRLSSFVDDPSRHARHAAKVLLKFKLLELQSTQRSTLADWARGTSYFQLVHGRYFGNQDADSWANALVMDLVRSGAARIDGDLVLNC